MKEFIKKIYYGLIREKNIEKAEFIAKLINEVIDSTYYCFPEKTKSEIAYSLHNLFNNIFEIMLKVINKYIPKIESEVSTIPFSSEEEKRKFEINKILEELNKHLIKAFCQEKIMFLLIFIETKKKEILSNHTLSSELEKELIEFYKKILKNLCLEIITVKESRSNIIIDNKEELIDNSLKIHYNYYLPLIDFYNKIFPKVQEKLNAGEQEYENFMKQLFKESISSESELEFYRELAENYIKNLKEEFERLNYYEQYKETVDWLLEKIKVIIISIKFIPKHIFEFRGIINYLTRQIFYIFADQKMLNFLLETKRQELEQISSKPIELINKEIEVLTTERIKLPFFESIVYEILIRIYTKLPTEFRFLKPMSKLENISELKLIKKLLNNYINNPIGINKNSYHFELLNLIINLTRQFPE